MVDKLIYVGPDEYDDVDEDGNVYRVNPSDIDEGVKLTPEEELELLEALIAAEEAGQQERAESEPVHGDTGVGPQAVKDYVEVSPPTQPEDAPSDQEKEKVPSEQEAIILRAIETAIKTRAYSDVLDSKDEEAIGELGQQVNRDVAINLGAAAAIKFTIKSLNDMARSNLARAIWDYRKGAKRLQRIGGRVNREKKAGQIFSQMREAGGLFSDTVREAIFKSDEEYTMERLVEFSDNFSRSRSAITHAGMSHDALN